MAPCGAHGTAAAGAVNPAGKSACLIAGEGTRFFGYEPMYGARPLKRYLQKNVETLAAKLILAGDVGRGDTILIDVKDGKLTAGVKK